jgi:LemA protein
MSELIICIFLLVVLPPLYGLWRVFWALCDKRNLAHKAWSELDAELARRHDLVPNLVSAVQGCAPREQEAVEAVTRAWANAVDVRAIGDPSNVASAEGSLTRVLRSLFEVVRRYPQLRAAESYVQQLEALTATEGNIELASDYYNDTARPFDHALRTFPGNLIAERLSFKEIALFDTVDERSIPKLLPAGGVPGQRTPRVSALTTVTNADAGTSAAPRFRGNCAQRIRKWWGLWLTSWWSWD